MTPGAGCPVCHPWSVAPLSLPSEEPPRDRGVNPSVTSGWEPLHSPAYPPGMEEPLRDFCDGGARYHPRGRWLVCHSWVTSGMGRPPCDPRCSEGVACATLQGGGPSITPEWRDPVSPFWRRDTLHDPGMEDPWNGGYLFLTPRDGLSPALPLKVGDPCVTPQAGGPPVTPGVGLALHDSPGVGDPMGQPLHGRPLCHPRSGGTL